MNETNFDIIKLDEDFSTTRRVIKADPQAIESLVKQSNKPEDKFETVLLLPEGEGRQGAGGLRTKGCFKAGGIIGENEVIRAKAGITEENCHSLDNKSHSREGGNPSSPETKPLITVVTVVYNGEQFLEETILSVIKQTYDNVEYIIIDGGSTDGTLDIIKKYEHAIDYWVSEKDKGIYDAMNKGIDLATGSLIGLLNADDYYFNNLIFIELSKIHFLNKASVYYGDMVLIDHVTKVVKEKRVPKLKKMAFGMYLNHPATFIDIKAYKTVGLFRSEKFKMAADYDLLLRCIRFKLRFKYINECLSVMRDGGVSVLNYKLTLDETYMARKSNLPNIYFLLSNLIKYVKKKIG